MIHFRIWRNKHKRFKSFYELNFITFKLLSTVSQWTFHKNFNTILQLLLCTTIMFLFLIYYWTHLNESTNETTTHVRNFWLTRLVTSIGTFWLANCEYIFQNDPKLSPERKITKVDSLCERKKNMPIVDF